MTKTGHIIEIEVIIGIIRILQVGTALEMIGNRYKYNRGNKRKFRDRQVI